MKGDTTHAIEYLNKTIEMGFNSVEALRKDPDLKSLQQNISFISIVGKLEERNKKKEPPQKKKRKR